MTSWNDKKCYIHKRAMDVFVYIQRIQYKDENRIKCKAIWFNLGYTGNPWALKQGSLEIPKAEWENYIEFDPIKEWASIRDKLDRANLGQDSDCTLEIE